jgi:NhaP-type Na+/H+ or K+/H+ antiporter
MNTYLLMITILGLCILVVAWLPPLLKTKPLSYTSVFVLLGVILYLLPLDLPVADPLKNKTIATHLTELSVILSLAGSGLKIDKEFSFKAWIMPIRLVVVTMLLSIGSVAVLGWWWLGLIPASAMLFAAAMAPTDPVLAGSVQVGPPGEGLEDNIRFSLTGEAGLNDGLAFPFVYLAIALLPQELSLAQRLTNWFLLDLLYRVITGVLLGWLSGKVLAYLVFELPKRINISGSTYGFIVIAITLVTYGITEMARGYGFMAVFVAALALRGFERDHAYHKELHNFSDQLERILMVIVLVFLGGAIADGMLKHLTWEGVVLSLLFIFIIRPLTGLAALIKTEATVKERITISFFGIRGIGSFFYLAYALEKADFPHKEELWAMAAFTVVVSILIHGFFAAPVMRWMDIEHNRPVVK